MQKLLFFFFMILLTGCGARQALDATRSMPDKMDKMSSQMDETNGRIDQTNEKMAVTQNGIHLQILQVALAELFKEENTRYLSPPAGMMAPGKVFAEEATPVELMEISFAWISMMKRASSMDPLVVPELQVGTSSPPSYVPSQKQLEKIDRDKIVKFTALQIVAAFTPEKTLDSILHQQVEEHGMYENTAYAFLALRYSFTDLMLLKGAILLPGIKNEGQLREAILRNDRLDQIARLPYANEIKFKMGSFESDWYKKNPPVPSEIALPEEGVANNWKMILSKSDGVSIGDRTRSALRSVLETKIKAWDKSISH